MFLVKHPLPTNNLSDKRVKAIKKFAQGNLDCAHFGPSVAVTSVTKVVLFVLISDRGHRSPRAVQICKNPNPGFF
jgi:hypothetical protein